ncbi:MAG: glycerophosphodiester phosphodiesterase family protein [Spirochaetales bacterium]|nr:glycerophosphodiester phosphodiesterase family protein [Spirochaetales bacterium]
MRKLKLVFFLMLISLNLFAQERAEQIRSILLDASAPQVLVTAHRGAWRFGPENSILSIEKAIEIGVDIIEIDIRKTADGHLVLMHDETVNRTTDGKGSIDAMTLEQLKNLRLKDHNNNFTDEKIPTLEDALVVAKGRILINLDKAETYYEDVLPLLKKTGTTRQIIMKGDRQINETVEYMAGLDKDIIYMPIVKLGGSGWRNMKKIVQLCEKSRCKVIELVYPSIWRSKLKKEQLVRLKELGVRIWYNTLWDSISGGYSDPKGSDGASVYDHHIDNFAGILQTDTPVILIDYLRSKNLKF